jgi:hypothetical protein
MDNLLLIIFEGGDMAKGLSRRDADLKATEDVTAFPDGPGGT